MGFKEIIFKETEIQTAGVLDFKEFLSNLREFFKRYDFGVDEKKYETKAKEGLKNTNLKWMCDRKYNDYSEGIINVTIELTNYKEGYADGKKIVEGDLKVKINGEMNRDYGDKWKNSTPKIFFRAIYDKYVVNVKEGIADSELKKTIKNLIAEIKQYLQI